VSLGALGIVASVTLDIEPTFDVEQRVLAGLSWQRALDNFDAVTSAAYSVSLFTDWQGEQLGQLWLKTRSDAAGQASGDAVGAALSGIDLEELLGARSALGPVHMLEGVAPENCTPQQGIPGPWHERLPHFRLEFTPSNGAEIQSEYLVPGVHAVAAIEALRGIRQHITPMLQITEIRTMAADELWLSEAYGRDTVGLHFTWRRDQAGVEAALVYVEAALEPFDARPHWGKVFLDADGRVASLYPRMPEFRALAERYDPRGVFLNAFLERHVFA
jgi:FAD/FMN-containing dehydrogenases